MAVYGYVRVSTKDQAADGESLAVQRRQVEGYAMQHGWPLDEVFVECGVSGGRKLETRPQGALLLERIRRGDVIIAPKLDRIFRSATDALRVLESLKAKGVALHLLDMGGCVTGNGIAQMVFTILSAVAQFERERIGERIRDVKDDLRTRGRYLGGNRPFGYAIVHGRLVPDTGEQQQIATIHRLKGKGLSHRAIGAEVGVPHATVSAIIRRGSMATSQGA